MVGLTGQIGAGMVIHALFLEVIVAQIGPQHGDHTQLMSALKGDGNFFQLATRLFRTEIDGGTDRNRTEIKGLVDAGVQRLIVLRGIAEGFVMVQFDHKGNAVRITTRDGCQHAIGGRHAVTARFDGQLDDVLWIEIEWIGSK